MKKEYRPIKYNYAKQPYAVDEYVFKTPTLQFLFGWLGIKKPGLRTVVLNDGTEFRAYPISTLVHTWSHILRGAVDVTGGFWSHVNNGKPALNGLELDGPFTAREGSPWLKRITAYARSGAPLPKGENPALWPEPYRSAWYDGV